MSVRRLVATVTLSLALAPAVQVDAHHAFAARFDSARPVTLRGVVTRVDWVNPHVIVYLKVETAEGAVVTWVIEAGSPEALLRAGWQRDAIPSSVVVATGFRARNGTPTMFGRELTLEGDRRWRAVAPAASGLTGAP